MENVVIIGAGQSAIQCITSLKKEGYDGSITLIGEENRLPYQRPPLSKAFLENRYSPSVFDVQSLVKPILSHRLRLNISAKSENVNIEEILDDVINHTKN